MKIAFTPATISFLPMAYTLADSFLRHNPDYEFYIFLLDPVNDHTNPFRHEKINFISIAEINIRGFGELQNKYSISEMSFALKPALFLFLLENIPDVEHVFYFDSDIFVYNSFDHAEKLLDTYDVLLTPHFLTTVNDDKIPSELDIVRTGIYNMGFAAFGNTENSRYVLRWWKKRVFDFGFENRDLGFSADQMYMSIVPVVFKNVGIIRHKGYNFAFWNIHERKLSVSDGKYFVNNNYPLVFVHFAKFNPHNPDHFTGDKHFNRVLPGEDQVLDKLCREYANRLVTAGYDKYIPIRSIYAKSRARQAYARMKMSKSPGMRLKNLFILGLSLLPRFLKQGIAKFGLFVLRNIK